MSRIRIINKNDEFNSDYDIGDMAAYMSKENPEYRSRWTKTSMSSLILNRNRPQKNRKYRETYVSAISCSILRGNGFLLKHRNICIRYSLSRSTQKPVKDWSSIRVCIHLLKCAPDHTLCL